MDAINTEITRLLNIKTPIIAPAMAGVSGGALAAQVTLAGGFGFIGTGYGDVVGFRKELELARSILQGKGGVHDDSVTHGGNPACQTPPLAIGVGFLGWTLDQPSSQTLEMLPIALDARVSAVWFSFGNDLGKWIRMVRMFDSNRSTPHKTLVFVLVSSAQEAKTAVREWNVDVLVAQGIEAGGHGHSEAPPLLALLPEILNAFADGNQHGTKCPPVVAAGGLSTGAHVAALLTLGASGVALGTRFVLSTESHYKAAQKATLLAAHGSSTVRSTVFDAVRGTLGWPAGIDGRALRNQIVSGIENGETLEEAKQLFEKATREGDANGMIVWSGTGVGLVNEIKPAGDIVTELHQEMLDRLRATSALLTTVTSV
ncbi:2-nitropropane dioxygenase [Phellopilus nigrolimitatus]|nr:2-nitropropane dioxygenase [Phellopilus nigrolimitatus]